MEIQPGDVQPRPFSFSTEQITQVADAVSLDIHERKNASDYS